MTVRDEIVGTPSEVCDAMNNRVNVCGRRRDGEAAVSWRAEPRVAEACSKQYVEVARGEPARLDAESLRPSWSERRLGGYGRSAHELCGIVPDELARA